MGASQRRFDTTPAATKALRDPLAGWLSGGKGFGGMFAEPGYIPNEQRVGLAKEVGTSFSPGRDISRDMVRDVSNTFGSAPVRTQFDPTQIQANFNPQQIGTSFIAQQVGGRQYDPNMVQANFNPAPAATQQFGFERASAPGTQSVDQLGGANSAFFQSMIGQLSPAFEQQRALAVAAAREGAGNLTGSGFANALGNNLGRTMGEQQARLADYATQGLGMETQRQQSDAARILQAAMANQGAGLQAAEMGQRGEFQNQQAAQAAQEMGLRAMLANQQAGLQAQEMGQRDRFADQSAGLQGQELGLRAMLANQQAGLQGDEMGLRAMLANQQAGLQGLEMGQRGELANQASAMQAQELGLRGQLANQTSDMGFLSNILDQNRNALQAQELGLRGQMANQGAFNDNARLNAELESRRQLQMGQTDAEMRNANAQRYAALLGQQSTAGVGPDTIHVDQDWKSMLPSILGALGSMNGGQGNPLSGLMGMLGGGGQNGQNIPWASNPNIPRDGDVTPGWVGPDGVWRQGAMPGATPGYNPNSAAGGYKMVMGPGGLPMMIPTSSAGGGQQGNVLSQIMGAAGRVPGGINLGRGGTVLNPNAIGGALINKGMNTGVGRAVGGALGSLIPIPGVGSLAGAAAGAALAKPLGKLGKGVSKALKKIF